MYQNRILTNNVKRLLKTFPLYGILDSRFQNFSMFEQAQEMLNRGFKIIQYRNKEENFKKKLAEVLEIKKLFYGRDALFIVNDDLNLCLESDAHGVHLGQDDISVAEARKILPKKKYIGLSTHSVSQALSALGEKINYIGVGPVFSSKTKQRDSVGLSYVRFCSFLNIPKVAIGGINTDNYRSVLQSGIGNVCSIEDLLKEKSDFSRKIEIYRELFEGV